ncbi:MAG: hypothetical protein ACTSPV_10905 [Candidatus Hodarchaeales archaeon]
MEKSRKAGYGIIIGRDDGCEIGVLPVEDIYNRLLTATIEGS